MVIWKNGDISFKYFFFWFLIWAKKLSDLYFYPSLSWEGIVGLFIRVGLIDKGFVEILYKGIHTFSWKNLSEGIT